MTERSNPREDPEASFQAFMSMGDDEWQACLRSVLSGGVFQPAEQLGFERALQERPRG